MSKNKIDLSIIIPVYNGEKYIKQCLNSIYNNFKKISFSFETIIINDGSEDNSQKICEEYSNKYNNIKLIQNSNHGVSFSRNCGVDNSSGKYVMFVDCDDFLKEEWYLTINKYLNENYDFIFFSKDFDVDTRDNEKISKTEILSYVLTYNDKNIRIPGPCSKIYLREFIQKNKINFDERIINGEDMLFNVKTVINSKSYLLIKDSYYIVRINGFSSTSQFNERLITSEKYFFEEMCKTLKSKDILTNHIEKTIFMINIRTLTHRASYLSSYQKAKQVYINIMKDDFFKTKLKMYKYDLPIKSMISYYLFRTKIWLILYYLCRVMNKKYLKKSYDIL